MSRIPFAVLALAGAVLGTVAAPARAVVLDATFSGRVQSQTGTSFAVGSTLAGEFLYDTVAARFLTFTVGGQSVAPGFASTAALTPDLYTALYQAQVSPVAQPGSANSTFVVDLEAANQPWAATSAVALLSDASQLAANLDRTASSFGYYLANADGSNVRSVSASIGALQVTAPVPEPTSVAMLLAGLALVGGAAGGRRGRR